MSEPLEGFGSTSVVNFGGSIFSDNSFLNFSLSHGDNFIFSNSLGYNLTDENDVIFDGIGDQISTDPLLGPLANNGGPTRTHLPSSTSPALDTGNCLNIDFFYDQRGFARPFDVPGAANLVDGCDIGAVEWTDLDGDGVEDGDVVFIQGFESPL